MATGGKKKKKVFFKSRTVYTCFSGEQEAQEGRGGSRNHGMSYLYTLVDLSEFPYLLVILGPGARGIPRGMAGDKVL